MKKIGILVIDAELFDKVVWDDKTDFNQAGYNAWLKSAVCYLQELYDIFDSSDLVSPAQLYNLGDVINMLDAIKIQKL